MTSDTKKPRSLSGPRAIAALPRLRPGPSRRYDDARDAGARGTGRPSETLRTLFLSACRHAAPPGRRPGIAGLCLGEAGPPGPVYSTRQYTIGRRRVKSLFPPPNAECRMKRSFPSPLVGEGTSHVAVQTGGRPDASSGTVAGGAMTVIRRQRPERNRPHIASPSTITYADAADHGPKMPHSGLR